MSDTAKLDEIHDQIRSWSDELKQLYPERFAKLQREQFEQIMGPEFMADFGKYLK